MLLKQQIHLEKRIAKLEEKKSGALEDKQKLQKLQETVNRGETSDIIVIDGLHETLSVKYPKFFFDIKGHDLENLFFSSIYGKKLTAKISENIYSDGLKTIPMDLASKFFELNEKIRNHVRTAIGKV